jgi:outer membrane protein assembly factor BamB
MTVIRPTLALVSVVFAVSLVTGQAPAGAPAEEMLFEAARSGDVAGIDAALTKGARVDATARYNMTALIFAASNGRFDAVKMLVARGANVNAEDTFYRFTPGDAAAYNGHVDIALFLLQNGWNGADELLLFGVQSNNPKIVNAALQSPRATRQGIQAAIGAAERLKRAAFLSTLNSALGALPAEPTSPPASAPPSSSNVAAAPPPIVPAPAPSAAPKGTAVAPARTTPRNWPSFRGEAGAGNGDGQGAVTEWDVTTGRNIKWKTAIPGLANSSPIIWGNRVFVTTAVSHAGDNTLRTGLYGDVKPLDDLSEHQWKIFALDKQTGRLAWERIAFTSAPLARRHPKATQANSTPATDGRRVVAAFGSIGLLVAWDSNGKELWRATLGVLDSGWFLDPSFQWGHSSSPIIHGNLAILQADINKNSYIAAWDLETGKQVWKTSRADEIPTWGTPAILLSPSGRAELVTNGTKVRGYDPATGKLLWTLGPNSEITVGTPVAGHGLVFVTGGYPPVRPIYAIRPGAIGDISLPKGSDSSDAIAWSNMTDGTYIPSPLVYKEHLITLSNNGVATLYNARTGERAFRGRIGEGGAFSASPIAADGRLYVASEDGEIHVVAAEPGLMPIAKNDMKEVVMATPAISDGLIVVRTTGHVYGIGR